MTGATRGLSGADRRPAVFLWALVLLPGCAGRPLGDGWLASAYNTSPSASTRPCPAGRVPDAEGRDPRASRTVVTMWMFITDDPSERAAILAVCRSSLNSRPRAIGRAAAVRALRALGHGASIAVVPRWAVDRILSGPSVIADRPPARSAGRGGPRRRLGSDRRQARRRIPTWAAAATTAAATLASEPGAGKRYDGPWTWMAAMTSPSADATGAATDEMPSENSSRTQA